MEKTLTSFLAAILTAVAVHSLPVATSGSQLLTMFLHGGQEEGPAKLETCSFKASSSKTITSLKSDECGRISDEDTLGDVALVGLSKMYKGKPSCFNRASYASNGYTVRVGTLSSGASSFEAFEISPPANRASKFVFSGTGIWLKLAGVGEYTVYSFDGSDFTELTTVDNGAAKLEGFTKTGVRVDGLSSKLLILAQPSSTRVSVWPVDADGTEHAEVWSASGFTVLARRVDVSAHGRPFDSAKDFNQGPAAHSNKYGTTKKFWPVWRGAKRSEGVVWQDASTLKIFVTWFEQTPSTLALPSSGADELEAACGNDDDEIVYLVVRKGAAGDKVTPLPVEIVKVDAMTGKRLKAATVDSTADGQGLNMYAFSSSGASMVWNKAKGEIGLVIARTMLRGGDGLNHQGAIAVVFDASSLKLIKNHGQTSGHSFANSLMVSTDDNFVGMDLGDNYPRGINLWRFDRSSKASKLVYSFKTKHKTTARSPAGQTYDEYKEISGGGTTYYKWSNDNAVYTEIGHRGLVETDGAFLVFFAGEQPPLDNSKVGRKINAPRDIGFVSVSKDMRSTEVFSKGPTMTSAFYSFGGRKTAQTVKGVEWLTSHKPTNGVFGENACRIKTVHTAGKNLLLYEVWGEASYVETRVMEVDNQGRVTRPMAVVGYPFRVPPTDDAFAGASSLVVYSGVAGGKLVRYELTTASRDKPDTPTATSPPSHQPSAHPTGMPSQVPSATPTGMPTDPADFQTPMPSFDPSSGATAAPTPMPTLQPDDLPGPPPPPDWTPAPQATGSSNLVSSNRSTDGEGSAVSKKRSSSAPIVCVIIGIAALVAISGLVSWRHSRKRRKEEESYKRLQAAAEQQRLRGEDVPDVMKAALGEHDGRLGAC